MKSNVVADIATKTKPEAIVFCYKWVLFSFKVSFVSCGVLVCHQDHSSNIGLFASNRSR